MNNTRKRYTSTFSNFIEATVAPAFAIIKTRLLITECKL